jgi:hypothetical protein
MSRTFKASFLSMAVHAMVEGETAGSNGSTEVQDGNAAPAMTISVVANYSFRRFEDTPANRAEKLPKTTRQLELTIEDQKDADGKPTGKKVFKRKTETYTLIVPTPQALGMPVPETEQQKKESAVVQSIITGAIENLGRSLVDQGIEVTPENCNWDLAVNDTYERIAASGGSSGITFTKEYLEEIATKYGEYAVATGKNEGGTAVIQKLIQNRFNKLSTRKFTAVLPMIQTNIENFLVEGLTAEEQEATTPVIQYLCERIQAAMEPEEQVSADMFA